MRGARVPSGGRLSLARPRPLRVARNNPGPSVCAHRLSRCPVFRLRRRRRGRAALVFVIEPQGSEARGRRPRRRTGVGVGADLLLLLLLAVGSFHGQDKRRLGRGGHWAVVRGVRLVGRLRAAVRVGVEQCKGGRRCRAAAGARPAPFFGGRLFGGRPRRGGGGIAVVVAATSRRRRGQGVDDLVVVRAPVSGLALFSASLLFGRHRKHEEGGSHAHAGAAGCEGMGWGGCAGRCCVCVCVTLCWVQAGLGETRAHSKKSR